MIIIGIICIYIGHQRVLIWVLATVNLLQYPILDVFVLDNVNVRFPQWSHRDALLQEQGVFVNRIVLRQPHQVVVEVPHRYRPSDLSLIMDQNFANIASDAQFGFLER